MYFLLCLYISCEKDLHSKKFWIYLYVYIVCYLKRFWDYEPFGLLILRSVQRLKFVSFFLSSHSTRIMDKLSNKEQLVLQKIREFITAGEKLTIRALQAALGYASPRSISVMLDQLMLK